MKMISLAVVAMGAMLGSIAGAPVSPREHLAARWALSRMQELNIQQLEALYSLLDDDGDGELTVHEMIDLFDGINNDALLIDDCDGNPNPHHCKSQARNALEFLSTGSAASLHIHRAWRWLL